MKGRFNSNVPGFEGSFDDFPSLDNMKIAENKKKEDFTKTFTIKPLELELYLKQFVIDQDLPIQTISTKICTHFNRLRYEKENSYSELSGNIKNNMLLIGPTGVGKTFIVKLIADRLNVPFSRGDATKFSETGYIGGDVDDLVRNLYYRCDGDIERAEYGIIYVDEIDKIASLGTRGTGPDVSRGGVQRSLLKLMEEVDVDIKTPHDIASQMESVMQLQKTGKVSRRKINTKNILFILSGAFDNLEEIIKRRMKQNIIGFYNDDSLDNNSKKEIYKNVIPEDFIKYGFESEFIGRIPIIIALNELTQDSLYKILCNDYSGIIISKKRDFESYGIKLTFEDDALKLISELASKEKTGARSLVRIVENTLVHFERLLPSVGVSKFTVTREIVENPLKTIEKIMKKAKVENIIKDLMLNYGFESNNPMP